jgi:hypothetical protein
MPSDESISFAIFDVITPNMVVTLRALFEDDACDESEQVRIRSANHFGLPVVWGVTSNPDPVGFVWSSIVYRPIIPVMGCIPVGVA